MDEQRIPKHREWRGFSDTLFDYFGWLVSWAHIFAFLPKAPPNAAGYLLRLPAVIDSQLVSLRALPFRRSRLIFNAALKRSLSALKTGKIVFLAPSVPPELMAGFPSLTGVTLGASALALSCAQPLSYGSLMDCIHLIETKTHEKFDWDAFFSYFNRFSMYSPYIHEKCAEKLCTLEGKAVFCRPALLLDCPPELRFGLCAWLEQELGIMCVENPIDTRSPRAALESIILRHDSKKLPLLLERSGAELVISFGNETCGGTELIRLHGRTQREIRKEFTEYMMEKMYCNRPVSYI